jgi:hypothetical protein
VSCIAGSYEELAESLANPQDTATARGHPPSITRILIDPVNTNIVYAATLGGGFDGGSLAVAAGLLLAAELAYWAIEHDSRLREERAVALRRASGIAAVTAGGLLAGLVVVLAAGVDVGAGLPLAVAGAVAAAALLLLVVRLAPPTSSSS